MGQADELIASAREAGLDIALQADSPPPALPSAVSSAVYRILQESLTNVIRHVGPTRVTIELEYGDDAVAVRVVDEGCGSAADQSSNGTGLATEPGRGILGMRERCQLLGGELTAQPRSDGGFEVSARLPLAPAGVTQR